jgi:hypothetical protein
MKPRNTCRLPFLVAALAVLGACANQPAVIVDASVNSDPALVSLRPNEVVVLPVEDGTPARTLDTRVLRYAIADALPEKAYVPISIDHAEAIYANAGARARGSVVDATAVRELRGRLDEDAFLGVRVTEWDTSRLAATGRLKFSAEVMMTASSTGQPLWWGKVSGDVKAGGESGVVPIDNEEKLRSVQEMFGRYLLRELPRRNP